MNNIDININKAKIHSIRISFADSLPVVGCTIDLFCGDKRITDFDVATKTWDGKNQMDLPADIYELIGSIKNIVEKSAVWQCKQSLKMLPEVKDD